ncbi:family 2 encapsulin nanocompartment cargo protein polyprenyl transferase [Streptomyces sp. BI20]|uniref:family 2 encapsulin nanocompartment cargo protein polyprenyl transferase n=1 Tax=Streptomyces sp. BI20 TaxID=3403460 RepID=UPI003C788439
MTTSEHPLTTAPTGPDGVGTGGAGIGDPAALLAAVPAPASSPEDRREPATGDGPAGDGGAGDGGAGEAHEAVVLLARARETVDPQLRRAVEALPPGVRGVARYHFGWTDADGRPAPPGAAGGKAIRPALVLAAARALGGGDRDAVRAAAAVEIAHNFTLLHDDVIDEDRRRRGRATAWTVFGVPATVIAGDALAAAAVRLLVEEPHPAAGAAVARLTDCVVELCEGQHADCAFEDRAEVTLDECLAMATAKTGALLGCACALGGLYTGAGPEEVEALDAFGREAGLAFQLIDDLIGIWGDPEHTGKPAGADLVARKKSLPVVAALTSGTTAGAELAALYAGPLSGPDEIRRAAAAVERAGGRDWAQAHAADRMAAALQHLTRAVPDPAAAGELLALAEFVTRRTR